MAGQGSPDTPLLADDHDRLLEFIESAAASPMALEDRDFADELIGEGSLVAEVTESARPASLSEDITPAPTSLSEDVAKAAASLCKDILLAVRSEDGSGSDNDSSPSASSEGIRDANDQAGDVVLLHDPDYAELDLGDPGISEDVLMTSPRGGGRA